MTPARRLVALALIGSVLAVTGACSDDDTSSASKDRATTTTTTTTIAESGDAGDAAASADPAATQSSDSEGTTADVWSAPGEPSPLQLGTGRPEPEYPAGQDGTVTTLADGSVDLVIQQVDESSDQVLANVVVLVVGDDATARAQADGKLRPDEELPGNYYVSDANPKLRGVGLAEDVVLAGESKEQKVDEVSGRAAVSAALIARLAEAPGIPYRAKVSGGAIVELIVPNVDDVTIPG